MKGESMKIKIKIEGNEQLYAVIWMTKRIKS